MSPVIAYCDGLCEPRNPGGYACGGWVILPASGTEVRECIVGHAFFCQGVGATNNVAEYEAALACLRAIYRTGFRGPVLLRCDSQLMARQYTGEYSCNAPLLIPLLAKLRHAVTFFESVVLEWIPRERNEEADAESRKAYDEARRQRKESASHADAAPSLPA